MLDAIECCHQKLEAAALAFAAGGGGALATEGQGARGGVVGGAGLPVVGEGEAAAGEEAVVVGVGGEGAGERDERPIGAVCVQKDVRQLQGGSRVAGRPASRRVCSSATRSRSSGATVRAGFTFTSGRGMRMSTPSRSRTARSRTRVNTAPYS